MQNPIADPLVEDVISSDVAAAPVRLDVTEEGVAYVTLTIDHRVVDGHQTNAWLSRFVEILEGWPAP